MVFLFSSQTWSSTESETASYLIWQLLATDYFRFVLFCCEFFLQSLPRNVLKDSTESNSLHLKVHGGNNLLWSGSCHFPTQIYSQVLLRNSSNFVWSSVLSSDLLNSSGINLSIILSFKTVCPPFVFPGYWKATLFVFKISETWPMTGSVQVVW